MNLSNKGNVLLIVRIITGVNYNINFTFYKNYYDLYIPKL